MNNNYSINQTLDPRAVNKSSSSLPLLPIDTNLAKSDQQIPIEEPNSDIKNPHNGSKSPTNTDKVEITIPNPSQNFNSHVNASGKISPLELGKPAIPISDLHKERVLSDYHKSPETKKYEPNLKPKSIFKKTTSDFNRDDLYGAREIKLSQYDNQITEPLIQNKSRPAYFCGCLKKEDVCQIQ